MRVLKRLVSPAGFVLALLFFALPFVTVSCDAGSAGSVEASYSGLDLAIGIAPSIEATGGLTAAQGGPFQPGDSAPDPSVHALAILTAALLAAGVATSLVRPSRIRLLGTIGVAVAAGVLLVVTEVVAMSKLKPLIRNVVETQFPDSSTDNLDAMLDDVLHTRFGFWLALFTLVLVLLFSIAVAVRAWVRQ